MKTYLLLIVTVVFLSSCKTGRNVLGKKSYHEVYGKKLIDAGLEDSHLGKLWFEAARESLGEPIKVTLPLRQVGYFSAEKPGAVGLTFDARRGQKLIIQLKKNPNSGFVIYTEIWRVENGGRKLAFAPDTTISDFDFEVDESATYVLRMQPELLQSGEYTLVISVGPSLQFPVAGNAKIGSLWGAPRDGGARSHEGIDIFAPKRTPVVATSNGRVTRVTENEIGGKVLFLRPEGKDFSVYYAHLDEQLVASGQQVKRGDTIGRVGNTGNARTTPPHLHLGIYTGGGAIDPLVFVDPVVKRASSLPATPKELQQLYRLSKDTKAANGQILLKYSIVRPMALNTEFYWAEVNGRKEKLERGVIQPAKSSIATISVSDTVHVFERPDPLSPKKGQIAPGKLGVLGTNGSFSFVRSNGMEGWIEKKTK